jgi:predicted Rossmann fold flavoprotein
MSGYEVLPQGADVLVVGGGAAGLVAAIAAAYTGASVAVIEQGSRVGQTILKTGNGRCNLSNTTIEGPESAARYHNPAFVAPTLERYGCEAIRAFFSDLGLLTVIEGGDRVFPRTRSANSVLDVLRGEATRLGILIFNDYEAKHIETFDSGCRVACQTGFFTGGSVVLACSVAPLLDSLAGFSTVPSRPVLGPLRTEKPPLKGLDGVRAQCRVTLYDGEGAVAREGGELLFRDYGVSGIVVFNLSRFAEAGQTLSLDFFSELTVEEMESLLIERWERNPCVQAGEFLSGMVHARIAQALAGAVGLKADARMDTRAKDGTDARMEDGMDTRAKGNMLAKMAGILKDYRLTVTAGPDRTRAQAIRGGLAIEGFDPATLRSRLCPRVFAAGECLDVDGPCGGFNLHWAWASGLVAGENAGLVSRNAVRIGSAAQNPDRSPAPFAPADPAN